MATTLNRENATCRWLLASTSFATSTDDGTSPFDGDGVCPPDFDKSLCWFNVSRGSVGQRACPFAFCPSVPGCESAADVYKATRQCHDNGTWGESTYTECINLLRSAHQHCVVGYCRTCPDPLRETVINVSLSLSIVSVIVLLSALLLFSAFEAVQCRRLSIHKNLAAAFVCRFAVLAVWTIANSNNAFRDCSHFVPIPLRHWEWLCKGILWMVIYFQVASVMWMLIEGIYLYSRFTVFAMRRSEAPYAVYLLTGWGLPFVVVMAWTVVHEHHSRLRSSGSFCWLPYAQGAHLWILAGTMGLALILNVLLLLFIVLILVQKLRSESTAESKKIWRTVKSTILLVPLLGVSNIPLFYEPSQPSAFYMLGSAILQHSQGIFIAVLYCFLNGEIQNALRRKVAKVPLMRSLGFPSRQRLFETERTYVPAHTTDLDGAGRENGGQVQLRDMNGVGNGTTSNSRRTKLMPSTEESEEARERMWEMDRPRDLKGRPTAVQSSSLNADLSKEGEGGGQDSGPTTVMFSSLGPIELEGPLGEEERSRSPDEEEESHHEQRLIR